MASRIHRSIIGMTVALIGFILAVALPVWAQDATIGIAVTIEPEAPYHGAPADFTITVEASGGAVSEVAVQIEGGCFVASGPIEVIGNGDDILEPGEQWEYTCHAGFVWIRSVSVTVTGVDGVGSAVSASVVFDYGIPPLPVSVEVATSVSEVHEGEEVMWEALVGNHGPYSIVNVGSRARLNESGPFSVMNGPVETSGNGDDVLDPGELWEYHWSAVLWQDSFVSVDVSLAAEHAPGAYFGPHTVSDVVTVIHDSPPAESTTTVTVIHDSPPAESTTTVAATATETTLPNTGPSEPLRRVGTLGIALLLFGVAMLAAAAGLGQYRRR